MGRRGKWVWVQKESGRKWTQWSRGTDSTGLIRIWQVPSTTESPQNRKRLTLFHGGKGGRDGLEKQGFLEQGLSKVETGSEGDRP